MNKRCARCEKIVYPTEELKCLDRVWHKGCFKCQVCNMTLNMKNYKGFDKKPYCTPHYPSQKHTVVADTPESRRIAENTKIQSNVKYHEDFEKQKGKKITVAEDPEMTRIKQNTQIQSGIHYKQIREHLQEMEERRPAEPISPTGQGYYPKTEEGANGEPQGWSRTKPGSISDYDPMTASDSKGKGTPYSARNSQTQVIYDSDRGKVENSSSRRVGSISDYDPMNDRYGSIAGQYGGDPRANKENETTNEAHQQKPQQAQQQPQAQQPRDRFAGKGMVCQAVYDYTAADTDEVTFAENDTIIFCQPIDAGWMEGTVERTGQRGMLPANYVEQVH